MIDQRPGILRYVSAILFSTSCFFLGGCDAGSQQANVESQTSQQDPQLVAKAAKQQLLETLSSRLAEVLQTRGPVAAIEVCSQEAEQIAAKVGDELGVNIGRTSLKRRNPSNVPPQWAEQWIEQEQAEEHFAELGDGRTAGLFPIPLQAKCVMCHGVESQISDPIRNQLSKLYPDDQATGFREGDLRGWVWVEVPAS